MTNVQILGKVRIECSINVKTGLHIGGTVGGLKIGGVDSPVITDPYGRPYIPGSSLKGKMRSLIEKKENLSVDQKKGLHLCTEPASYEKCPVCKVWGTLPGDNLNTLALTRLIVRDTFLDESSVQPLRPNLDLPWTEVKTETAINRLTGTAGTARGKGTLRQTERVPAGAVFKPCELFFTVFEDGDKDLLKFVFEAMELLEHDYLGGMGSRGYGKIAFSDIAIYWFSTKDYQSGNLDKKPIWQGNSIAEIVKTYSHLRTLLTHDS
jgi:CRISPR-associated protein Csm3